MIKYLSLLLAFHFASAAHARAEEADYSTFTLGQIAEHLDLQGGNWEVSLGEKCFLGFVITKTSAEGEVSKDVSWSRTSSQQHRFFLSYHVTPGSGEQLHNLRYSSVQVDEDDSSSGSGWSRGIYLPQTGTEYFGTETLKITQGEPATLYLWSNDEAKGALRLEVLFSPTKEEK